LQVIEQVFKQLEWCRLHRVQQNSFINWEKVKEGALRWIVNQELFTFSKLLPAPRNTETGHRQKSGFIKISGDALKFLFRVATSQQVQELHVTVESIKDRDGDVIHELKK
jgi:hypothetical protein